MKQTDKVKQLRRKELQVQRDQVRAHRLKYKPDTKFLKGSVDPKEEKRLKRKAYQKAYDKKNKEKIKAYKKEWYEANEEKIRVQQKAYQAANPEKRRAWASAFRAANPEYMKEYMKEWMLKCDITNESFSTEGRLKAWGEQIRHRDNNTCGVCGANQETEGTIIDAHHIKSKENYPQYQFDLSNGVTLCRLHHKAEHSK